MKNIHEAQKKVAEILTQMDTEPSYEQVNALQSLAVATVADAVNAVFAEHPADSKAGNAAQKQYLDAINTITEAAERNRERTKVIETHDATAPVITEAHAKWCEDCITFLKTLHDSEEAKALLADAPNFDAEKTWPFPQSRSGSRFA